MALLEEVHHWSRALRIKCPTFSQLTLCFRVVDAGSQLSAPVAKLAMRAVMSSMMESHPLELGANISFSLSCLWSRCFFLATERKLM